MDLKRVFQTRRYRNNFRAKTIQAFRKRTDKKREAQLNLPVYIPLSVTCMMREKRGFVNLFLLSFLSLSCHGRRDTVSCS